VVKFAVRLGAVRFYSTLRQARLRLALCHILGWRAAAAFSGRGPSPSPLRPFSYVFITGDFKCNDFVSVHSKDG
jgi:hypothetical protein